ncbi:TerD family protein [Paenibacillus bovis]|uniref:TerD family protein n=1 Tax=Paenibacillus bovis TaxID=1616788 RepID=UPI0007616E54|nr:TerD family protein [Paenibacillus bovis]
MNIQNVDTAALLQIMNPVFLRRSQKIILPPAGTLTKRLPADRSVLAALLKNIESLGYTFSAQLTLAAESLNQEQMVTLYETILPVLQKILGAHVQHRPMYPNFPDEVMEASEVELYLNAVLHYTHGLLPNTEVKKRPLSLDHKKLKVIDLGTEQQFTQMMRSLAGANGSLSDEDKADLATALTYIPDIDDILPDEIPYKENAAWIASVLLTQKRASTERLSRYFRTATDVLRLAAGLSGLDTSLYWAKRIPQLTQPFQNIYNMNQGMNVQVTPDQQTAPVYHFRKFKRAERRFLLGLLEKTSQPLEDMVLYRELWKRLGEILHPGEMRNQYPHAFEAFTRLRREKHIPTFRSEVEQGLYHRDAAVIARLASRPGELARRLDLLLRSQPQAAEEILNSFNSVISQIAVPLLLQLMAHFKHRNEHRDYRVFFPKGNMGKAVAIYNHLPSLNTAWSAEIVQQIEKELRTRFADRPALGRVYIDPVLAKVPVPFSQRSASQSLRPLPRGSRVAMPSGETVRLFCWWTNLRTGEKNQRRVDVDLSLVLMDEDWNPVETLAFYNLKESYGVHSGDITDAGKEGASEFIDLHIQAVREATKARYAMMQVACFTGQAFAELPECFAGFMMRTYSQTGKIYDPRTVETRFDLTVEAQQAVPLALDLEKREMIWMDAVLKNRSFAITAEQNMSGMQLLGHAFADLHKTTLIELFTLHGESRGTLVDSIEEADTVFAMEEGITPYHTDVILSEYL